MEIFPFTICGGQFLGDDVVIAGTDVTKKQSTCQVKIVDFSSGQQQQNQSKRHMVRGEASLRGRCSAMELCGVPSINKNYVAVAVNDANKGFVSLLEVQSSNQVGYDQGMYQMAPVQAFEQKPDEESHFNSLAYYSYHAHLAAATETGDVVITDLASATDLTRRRVDPAGALAVRYTPAGLVVSLGQSNAGQVLLWDPRTANSGEEATGGGATLCFQRPLFNDSRGLGVAIKDSYLTCLETHPSNEYEFYCGTSTGSIVMWDIRKSDISEAGSVVEMERSQHCSGGEVTALAFRGTGRSPHLLSGAADGSVACVNYHHHDQQHLLNSSNGFRQSDGSSSLGGGGGGSGEEDIGFDQGTSAITSLQSHPHSGKILITSKLGEVNLL